MRQIIAKYDPPPIRWHGCDWIAFYSECEPELLGAIGFGATREEAIADLAEWDDEFDGEISRLIATTSE